MKRIGLALAAAALVAGCKKKEAADGTPPPAVASDAAPTAEVPAPPDAAPEAVTFTIVPPAVGDVRDVTDVNHLTGTVKAAGMEQPLVQHREEKRTEEVLAVEGRTITKMKVTYTAVVTHEQAGDESTKPSDPRQGKSFVLSWEKGKVVVRDEAGKVIPADRASEIQGGVSEFLGREQPMHAILTARTFRTGERVVLTPEEAKSLTREGQSVGARETALTLLERKDDVATLALESGIQTQQGAMTVEVAMKGTIKVQISTGRLLEMNMAGDLKGSGTADLTGTMSGTKVFVYREGKK